MEFANAISELNDSEEQAERFEMQVAERAAGAADAEEGDPDFVEAMSYGMPPTGGCGIGMGRLALALPRRDTPRGLILFPAPRQPEGSASPSASRPSSRPGWAPAAGWRLLQ